MTTLSPIARHHRLDQIWRDPPRGAAKWFAAVNHTTLGRRFMLTALVFFLVGGVLAMLLRTQLATSGNAFLTHDSYHQTFTMHGTVMMFLFAIPMLEGFALYLIPKIMGARDLSFPRLGAYAYWCYLFGGLILIVGLLAGVAPLSGWFMYTPLSSTAYSPGINADLWLIGVTFAEISAICGAVELVVSILRLRAPGMGLNRLPLFAWYMLVTAVMILVGFPPLILGSILLEVERAFGWPFFDVSGGGDPLLWQHLFWMFGHPEVYIIFLPAAGMVSTLIPTFSRHPLVGYSWVVAAAIAMGFISFGLWVHHMFTVGIPHLGQTFFSAASMLVVIPTAIQVFAWISTLWSGRPVLRLPMLYLFGFLVIFVAGGLTGVMVALVPFDWQVHDTHFVVAHFHYVLIGGMVFPVIAAAYYWLPHFTGRMPSDSLGIWGFWFIFIGFNLTFLVMHLTGLLGMPRRVYMYGSDWGWDVPNLISSMGAFVQTIGFTILLLDFFLHARIGKVATRNPWDAGTLEWATPTPVAPYNFAAQPWVNSRYPLWEQPDLGAQLAAGRGLPGSAFPTRRETIGVDVLTGEPQHLVILPGPSWLPFIAAVATGAFFVAVLFKTYIVALIAVVGALAIFVVWAWRNGAQSDPVPVDVGEGVMLLPHFGDIQASPGRAGLLYTLLADATLLASLLFGWVYLFTVAPNWPPGPYIRFDLSLPLVGLVALAIAYYGARRACLATGHRRSRAPFWMGAAGTASLIASVVFVCLPAFVLPPPGTHAYAAVSTCLIYYVALHAGVGAVMCFFGTARCHAGYVSAMREVDVVIPRIWCGYTLLATLFVVVFVYGLSWGLL